jgi:uncharacterized membrane protein YeaQ/YmgE (transglycosylase-associated protein family)
MEQLFGGGIIWTLLIGFVVGLLARALKPGTQKLGILLTILLGVAGAILARFIGLKMGWYGPTEPTGFIASVIGALVLLIVFGLFAKKKA